MDENGAITKNYGHISKVKRRTTCGIPPLEFNGHVYNDSLGKAKALNDYFTSVFTPVSSAPPPMDDPLLPDITPIQIDPNGVVELLKNLKTHKAIGPKKFQRTYPKKQTWKLPLYSLLYSKHHCSRVLYHLTGKWQV